MSINFDDKVVLITGGTQGIGLCTGLRFAELGAQCVLTYHWGSADNDEVVQSFKKINAAQPLLIQADVSNKEDTKALMSEVSKVYQGIDIFINNVTVTSVITDLKQYSFHDLKKSMAYSSWPLVDYTRTMKAVFDRYPRYIVNISTTGVERYNFGYDYVAAAKSAMESLSRYLAYRLKEEQVNINTIRTRAVRTWSMKKTFGEEFLKFAKHFMKEHHWMEPKEIADATIALCSGYMDAMNGQILNVDRGTDFFDDLMHFYTKRDALGLQFKDEE